MLRAADKRLFVGRRLEDVLPPYIAPAQEVTGLATCTANASNNTKATTYTDVLDPTSIDADGFWLQLKAVTASRDFLVDVALGAASSEVNILDNVLFSSSGTGSIDVGRVYIPLAIPAGSRISARCQASTGSSQVIVSAVLVRGGLYRALRKRRATTYGADTSDSGGTVVDTGASAGSEGAWSVMSAAMTNPIEGAAVMCVGNRLNGARTTTNFRVDLGYGAALSEVELASDAWAQAEGGTDIIRQPFVNAFPGRVAAGSRLVVRAQSTITDATDRTFDAVVIGFD